MAIGNYLTTAEVAEMLNVTPMRIHQFVRGKRLAATRVGKQLFFERHIVAKFAKTPRINGRPKNSKNDR